MALYGRRVVAIDLAEVELVSRDAVKVFVQAEVEGIELRSCPACIREWITTEEKQLALRVVADRRPFGEVAAREEIITMLADVVTRRHFCRFM